MISLFAPSAIVASAIVLATRGIGHVRPDIAARLLALATVVVAGGVALGATAVSLGFLAHLPVSENVLGWCRQPLRAHSPIPAWIGIPALVIAAAVITRCTRVIVRWVQIRETNRSGVVFVDDPRPVAYTVPGPAGLIVVSRKLMSLLDPSERSAVLAHERAHASLRHDRYLIVAALGAAVGAERVLARPLRHSLERWADEVAARQVGDRRIVARALGRAALAAPPPDEFSAAMHAGSVTVRVQAMCTDPMRWDRRMMFATALATSTVALVTMGTGVQLHHLLDAAAAVCGG